MTTTPDVVGELVEKFRTNADHYTSPAYNETLCRVDFINPMFEALGWDMANRAGYADAYRDVIHEDAIKIGGATKAPDYCFRIGGTRKFFLEAKKPGVDLKSNPDPAYQLRRYAWSAKLPLSILTDFQEFAVYDCRVRPDKQDKPSTARIFYCGCDDYPEQWEKIASIFARESVLKGSFDRYAETAKGKRGTAEVDAAFLKEIESWRDALARNLALRNELSQRDLNFAVQRIIDRIIFLRICEDRGIEVYAQLQGLINGQNIYARLRELFNRADERYNSGLFHFQREKDRHEAPDELTPGLTVDDKVLKEIIRSLYYPDSPYEFSVLPADILGQVYEQFLGKVIRLTGGHRAVVEEKPEVRKAGGVYYTPTYIVDYIVRNTVGKLLEGKTPRQVGGLTETFKPSKTQRPIAILDPACGSGSFLIGAYQYLLDWYRDQYVSENPKAHATGRNPRLYQRSGGDWRLTTAERKRILLAHIYGVDIDSQAVETTKLSLLLKVLEGESGESLHNQLRLFHERALPDLGDNIKCGNSLIGPDFYDNQQMMLLDAEERLRVNVFGWNAEFPEIMKAGGFDAVIGNPPYIRVRVLREFTPEAVVAYLQGRYRCATHVWDIYLLFFERAVELSRQGGRFSFIVPIQTLHQPNCESLRKLLLANSSIALIADLSELRVFQGPIVKNCILVCEKGLREAASIETCRPRSPGDLVGEPLSRWPQERVRHNPLLSLKIDMLSPKRQLCEKLIGASWRLDELCYATFGLRSCAKGKGQGGKDRLITSDPREPSAKPYLEGRDIGRYETRPTGRYIRYIPEEMYSPRTPELFETKKIVSQTMLSKMRLTATLDDRGHYVEQSLLCIVPHGLLTDQRPASDSPLEFILAVLNSKLESFFFGTYVIDYSLGGGLIHATPGSQAKLLIPRAAAADLERVGAMATSMLALHKSFSAAKTGHEKDALQRQIDATDRQIDGLVYELYGLTDDEIRIVEEATA